MRVAATNQLAALLDTHWPGAKAIFADVESPIALEFLTRYPTPAAAARLGEKRLAAFCAKPRLLRPPHPPASCSPGCATPRQAPPAPRSPTRSSTRSWRTGHRAHRLNTAIKDLDQSVVTHLGEHPDGEIFTSLPRSGQINAAQMLAEWGDCREAYDGPDAVAALAGLTPVTKESGKHRAVTSAGPATNGSASR